MSAMILNGYAICNSQLNTKEQIIVNCAPACSIQLIGRQI